MAQEQAHRQRLEDLKQQELQQERVGLTGWQRQLLCGPQEQQQQQLLCTEGDESDYEDEQDETAASGRAGAMPDHPDYYGRGWRPSSSAAAAAASGGGGGGGESAGSNEDAPPRSSGAHGSSVNGGAAGSRNDSAQAVPGCDIWPAASKQAAAHSDASSSASELLPAAHEPVPPPLPLQHAAAVRCPSLPVKVTFTQLETQHLPARQQREVEIRSIKRQAQGQVRCSAVMCVLCTRKSVVYQPGAEHCLVCLLQPAATAAVC